MATSKAHDAVIRARTALLVDQPFFGCLSMQLKLVEVKEGHWLHGEIDTMAVDGYHLFYYSPFVLSLSELELMGVVAHEVFHCVFRHMVRRGHRDSLIWNFAGDFCINLDLKKANFTLPGQPITFADLFAKPSGEPKKGHLYDTRFDGMGTEEVYERLMQQIAKQPKIQIILQGGAGDGSDGNDKGKGKGKGQQKAKGKGLGIDPTGCGGVIDAGSGPKTQDDGDGEGDGQVPTPAQINQDWEANVRMAVAVAKNHNAGSVPAYLARLVTELEKPKVNWRDRTRNFVDGTMIKEYSWARPSRRSASLGIILPGQIPDALHHLVMLIDVSGSVGGDMQRAMVSEGAGALDDGCCDKLTIAYFDTEIKRVDEYIRGDLVVCETVGGGGTDFRQPYQWVTEACPDASCVIMLTDMCPMTWDIEDPGVPVLWGAFCPEEMLHRIEPQVPFGECVHVDSAGW